MKKLREDADGGGGPEFEVMNNSLDLPLPLFWRILT